MKILLAHNKYKYPGGEDTYTYSLKDLLERKGHQVVLYTKNNSSISINIASQFKALSGLFFNPKARSELKAVIEKERPDVAHFNNIYPLISPDAYRVCKKMGVPVIQTIHNYRLICPGGFMYGKGKTCRHAKGKFMKYLLSSCYQNSLFATFVFSLSLLFHKMKGNYKCVDAFIFPNIFTMKEHTRRNIISKQCSFVIPYFMPKIKLRKKVSQKNYFIFAGRLSEEKGILDLLSAYSGINTKLYIFGDGPLNTTIRKLIHKSNIVLKENQSREEVLKYMKGALATIIPCRWQEVGPFVMIESLAAGTPIIAPAFGMFKEVVKKTNAGLLFKFRSQKSLHYILVKYLSLHNSVIKKMKIADYYDSHYSEIHHYENLMRVYKSLLNNRLKKNSKKTKAFIK